MPQRRTAAVGLLFGGLAVLVGTVLPWTPSGGPLFLIALNGLDNGQGAVTVVLGLILCLIGGDALRRGGNSPVWAIGVAAGLLALLIVAPDLSWSGYSSGDEFLEWGPAYALYLLVLGSVIAVVASLRLRRPRLVGSPTTYGI